eukprot:15460906-Alexandrium_andersonii.AAC.1
MAAAGHSRLGKLCVCAWRPRAKHISERRGVCRATAAHVDEALLNAGPAGTCTGPPPSRALLGSWSARPSTAHASWVGTTACSSDRLAQAGYAKVRN